MQISIKILFLNTKTLREEFSCKKYKQYLAREERSKNLLFLKVQKFWSQKYVLLSFFLHALTKYFSFHSSLICFSYPTFDDKWVKDMQVKKMSLTKKRPEFLGLKC